MKSFNSYLSDLVIKKKSWLCVGLDISAKALGKSGIQDLKDHTFKTIDATRDYAVAYKPNFAFFERWGAPGFDWLEQTVDYIGNNHITIADAKRGDIGSTAEQYAKSIFSYFNFDCVTLNPYMGKDGILPFINNPRRGAFILCRTSNNSARDIQNINVGELPLYQEIAKYINDLNIHNNVGLVVGSTAQKELKVIREIAPRLPILMPGVGAQGGNLDYAMREGNSSGLGIISISRGISFTGDMSEKAIYSAAKTYVEQMRAILL